MSNIISYKQEINDQYLSTLTMMEKGEEVNRVRLELLNLSGKLNNLSLLSPVDKTKAYQKANFLLTLAKQIREEGNYHKVYKELTGNELPITENLPEVAEEKKPQKSKDLKEKEEDLEGYQFNWDTPSDIDFQDVAGLEEVKQEIKNKVLLPLTDPNLFYGYEKKNGGGLLLYGPPGTGKTMIGAAIAKEVNAKFCVIAPSDILSTGVGNTEKMIRKLFEEARRFDVAIIYFDEIDALCPKSTRSQIARQFRSELLTQIQGLGSYHQDTGKILYLIASTNKPWDIDPSFIRPGRFGTRIYVTLPDKEARRYMINNRLDKIKKKSVVNVLDINIDDIVERTEGYSGADMTYLLDEAQEVSIRRTVETGVKSITNEDFEKALEKVTSSIQDDDMKKLHEWRVDNNY